MHFSCLLRKPHAWTMFCNTKSPDLIYAKHSVNVTKSLVINFPSLHVFQQQVTQTHKKVDFNKTHAVDVYWKCWQKSLWILTIYNKDKYLDNNVLCSYLNICVLPIAYRPYPSLLSSMYTITFIISLMILLFCHCRKSDLYPNNTGAKCRDKVQTNFISLKF